ncbi:sodium-dependent lysophosphatidylcholine symporter 1-like isoform X3 [Podarcis raffonei]|uniref:sodium-dependent lysophosphatidylcholine symporter 1-like isoform X3 n=1 Tax=Podarcis raffonei TaxID=65483 RepID=UPI0023297884|nr:sodium-dependent lysophosphatidylcholine symporter 1-like isoform X3 [Podarcis raffonei]
MGRDCAIIRSTRHLPRAQTSEGWAQFHTGETCLASPPEGLLCSWRRPLPAHRKRRRVFPPDLLAGCRAAGAFPCFADPFPGESLGCCGRAHHRIPGQQKPPPEVGQTGPLGRLLHAIRGLLLHYALCYHVPYSSLTMFLGGSQMDRDSATAYRMGVEMLSTLLGSGIQGQIVGSHHASMRKRCDVANGTLAENDTSLLPDVLESARTAYVVASLVLGSLYFLSCLVLFLGVKEQPGRYTPLGKTRLPFFASLRAVLSHSSYTRLLAGFLLASLAFQLAQGIFAFFCTHAAGLPGSFQHLVLIMLVVACLSIPVWQWFLVRFGKKMAVFIGLSLIIPSLIVITVVTHNFLVYVFMVALAGSSLAVLYLLPWSMLPDAVDDFKLQNPTCLNLEAFFYSFYVFFNKLAAGLSLGISTMSLHFAGYRAADCTHNPQVILTLQILMAPVPIVLLLSSMAVFFSYPIDEKRRKQIRVEMEATGRHQGQTERPESEAS